jgi:hypothetical protein
MRSPAALNQNAARAGTGEYPEAYRHHPHARVRLRFGGLCFELVFASSPGRAGAAGASADGAACGNPGVDAAMQRPHARMALAGSGVCDEREGFWDRRNDDHFAIGG